MYKYSHKLSEIIYYNTEEKKNAQLKKGLQEYRLLVNTLKSGVDHLKNGRLEKFDALVGENACQIRAVKIAMIATEGSVDFSRLEGETSSKLEQIDDLLELKKLDPLMRSNMTLKEVIDREELDISLSKDEMFMLQSFLLSEMKASQVDGDTMMSLVMQDRTERSNLKNYGDISSSFASSTERKLRRLLSSASVEVVKELAWDLQDPELIEMASDKHVYLHNAWPTLPMYWTYATLLQACLQKEVPIVVRAKFVKKSSDGYLVQDRKTLYFEPVSSESGAAYVCTDPKGEDTPVCVIEGVVEVGDDFCPLQWRDAIGDHTLTEIILAGAADHRQYPNPEVSVDVQNEQFDRYVGLAQEKGFSLENPTTFFIHHVYSSQLKRVHSDLQELSAGNY